MSYSDYIQQRKGIHTCPDASHEDTTRDNNGKDQRFLHIFRRQYTNTSHHIGNESKGNGAMKKFMLVKKPEYR